MPSLIFLQTTSPPSQVASPLVITTVGADKRFPGDIPLTTQSYAAPVCRFGNCQMEAACPNHVPQRDFLEYKRVWKRIRPFPCDSSGMMHTAAPLVVRSQCGTDGNQPCGQTTIIPSRQRQPRHFAGWDYRGRATG